MLLILLQQCQEVGDSPGGWAGKRAGQGAKAWGPLGEEAVSDTDNDG